MKKGDLLILLACLLLAAAPLLLLLMPADAPQTAVIRQNGAVLVRLPLDKDTSLRVENDEGSNTIVVTDGQVFIAQADCPDRTCERLGHISRTGETLVCLPHRLTVTIEGGSSAAPDAVSQ